MAIDMDAHALPIRHAVLDPFVVGTCNHKDPALHIKHGIKYHPGTNTHPHLIHDRSNLERRPSPSTSNSNVRFFPTESLHSFSFSPQTDNKSELRRGLLYRSLDFVKNKYGTKYVESIINGTGANSNGHWLSAATGHLMNGGNGAVPGAISPTVYEDDDRGKTTSLPPIRSISSPNLLELGRQIASASADIPPHPQQPRLMETGGAPAPSRLPYTTAWQPTASIRSPQLLSPLAIVSGDDCILSRPASLSIDTTGAIDNVASLPPPLPSAPASVRAKSLNSPTRFLPPNNGMMTTDADLNVLTANDEALFIFGTPQRELIGASMLDLIAPSYRDKCSKLLNREPGKKDVVLVCGKVIRVLKRDGIHIPASLWLKRKSDEQGGFLLIWVFEAIKESIVTVIVAEMTCEVVEVRGPFQELFGWEQKDVYHLKIMDLIPAIDNGTGQMANFDIINQHKFFGAKCKRGASIPIIAKYFGNAQDNSSSLARQPGHVHIQITSMPNIAGVITADSTGIIQSCNSVFAKYLFGLGPKFFLQGHVPVTDLLPQFGQLVGTVEDGRSEKLLTARESRRVVAAGVSPMLTSSKFDHVGPKFSWGLPVMEGIDEVPSSVLGFPADITNPMAKSGVTGVVALHRDGSSINVDVQLRALTSHSETVYALWVTYDRSMGTNMDHKRSLYPSACVGMTTLPALPSSDPSSLSSNSASPQSPRCSIANNQIDHERERAIDEAAARMAGLLEDVNTGPPASETFINTNNNSSNCSSLYSNSASMASHKLPGPIKGPTSAVPRSIDDYEILDSLGDGAYGYVRLAVRKGDPTKTKVVLKYVVKSRILVDSWTRDKDLGLVPLEVHILHYLRNIPHPNIVSMIDHFEDPDFFYIVMTLHGFGMDLFDYIELNQSLPEEEIRSIFYHVVLGVRHLHCNGIVHRDIKDENVILDDELKVQLVDFGSSAYVRVAKKFDTFCGTLDYAAPEVLTGHKYTGPPQDCWALGILLYTLIYKENPFYNIDEIIGRELRVPFVMSEDSIDLIKFILNRDVKARPTIESIEQHEWFNPIRNRMQL
ncbi:hypothetical protein SeLEV6574_g00653 [Synchytrium endobioticum]|uniref:non-specific serine/threonine protein kinase n=1 Tax=Synchytrium endobioticum TaxID=286115 RepID=A0A507DGP7_9FUNG|nr:hypothetical protein SeLEV6574_g00653 [Synchytrium endobioticum]